MKCFVLYQTLQVAISVGLQVRKGTGFVPKSDLEVDEQVGGPFGNHLEA